MADRPKRVSVGFQGGQVLAGKFAPEALDRLRSSLGGEGWVEIQAEDGIVHLNLREIVYVLVDADEQRTGFFTSAA